MVIDFTNTDNLIFFFIVFVLFSSVIFVFLFLLVKLFSSAKKLATRSPERGESSQQDEKITKQENEAQGYLPKQRVLGMGMSGVVSSKPKPEGGGEGVSATKSQAGLEQQKIIEGLAKLKADSTDKNAAQTKMPSRLENRDENEEREIRIPRAKHFEEQKAEKYEIDDFDKTAVTSSHGVLKPENSAEPVRSAPISNVAPTMGTAKKMASSTEKEVSSVLGEKPDILKSSLTPKKQASSSKDASIFSGKEEITRIELRQKLRKDPMVAQAQRDLRMNLSPIERAKLEKEFFAPLYGRNISKNDLRVNLKRMGREWVSTGDMKRKETLRKQMKFLKKIGGIK